MATILIVDDEPEIRELIAMAVEKAGHEALRAADVGEAWALVTERGPSLVFADIDMPGETGIELVLRLREHPDHATLPVIFVTAYRERAHPLLSTGIGAVDVIDKPFRMEQLL